MNFFAVGANFGVFYDLKGIICTTYDSVSVFFIKNYMFTCGET